MQDVQPQALDLQMQIDPEGRPKFPRAKDVAKSHVADIRKVLIPPHRMTPLKSAWPKIYPPLGSLWMTPGIHSLRWAFPMLTLSCA